MALANTLNSTRAAEQCYVIQSALTQAIKCLETELGGKLISRNNQKMERLNLKKSVRSHFERIDRPSHMVRSTIKAVINGEISELNIVIMCSLSELTITIHCI